MKPETINGHRVMCYDNGGRSFDRYTAIYLDQPERGRAYSALAASERPFHPQGMGQHCTAVPGRHIGRRIALKDMPTDVQRAILQDCPNK